MKIILIRVPINMEIVVDRVGCIDTDLDGISDSYDPYPNSATNDVDDWDGDGFPDHSQISSENTDDFPNDNTQWLDSDFDGYGDNPSGTSDAFPSDPNEWSDLDGDGIGDNSDDCINSAGNSTNFDIGCPDTDGDGYADLFDAFPNDNTQWDDWDGDGYGENFSGNMPDSCPNQAGTSTLRVFNNQNETWYGCIDSDSDSYEDNSDPCPFQYGNSWVDRFACVDTDLDGISDLNDPYPNTPTSNISDWDDDGYPDNSDNPSRIMIHSHSIILNGLIQMEMDSVIIQQEIILMHSRMINLNGKILIQMESEITLMIV